MNVNSLKKSPLLMSFVITIVFIVIIYIIKTAQETFLEYKKTEKLRDLGIEKLGYQETLPKFNRAFSILEDLLTKVQYFLRKLKIKYPDDERVARLVSRMKGVDIQESQNEKDVSSFTIDKGEMISLCIRHKEDIKKFHDDNTLWFVVCHELAHVMSVSEGHNQEFIDNFKFLLKESADMYIYNPVDYSKKNINYCGVKVTNNPYFN